MRNQVSGAVVMPVQIVVVRFTKEHVGARQRLNGQCGSVWNSSSGRSSARSWRASLGRRVMREEVRLDHVASAANQPAFSFPAASAIFPNPWVRS
jgi:hypothetical protein